MRKEPNAAQMNRDLYIDIKVSELTQLREAQTKRNRLKKAVEEYRNAREVLSIMFVAGMHGWTSDIDKYDDAIDKYRDNLFAVLDET